MKKIYYESPAVEVVDVRVEAGFGPSDGAKNGTADTYLFDDYTDPMSSTDSY